MSAATLEHLRVEWRAALRSPSMLLMTWIFPLAFTLVLGGVMPSLNPPFRDTMVPAFATIALLTGTLLGLPTPMVEARISGVLRGFRVVGVPDGASLVVPALSACLHAVPAAVLAAALSVGLYDGEAPSAPGAFLAVLALTAFTLSGLGALVGVVSATGRAATLAAQALFLPAMMLGGMMVPFAALPASVRPWALALPTTHTMQLLEGLAYGRATAFPWGWHAAALATCGAVAWTLARACFETEPRELRPWRIGALLLALAPLLASAALAWGADGGAGWPTESASNPNQGGGLPEPPCAARGPARPPTPGGTGRGS